MAFLDIIVPQYKEDEKLIKGLLDSIERQKNIDFNDIKVIIVGDPKGYKLSKIFIKGYRKFEIEYIIANKHLTQGLAEQYALDRSNGLYVTFIDSDDELYGTNSLCEIIYGLKKNSNINILATSLDQENMINGKIIHTKVTYNMLRTLHGLFIKRQYIYDNDVKFNDRLDYFEDTYFTTCLNSRNDLVIISNITYVWKYNLNSKALAKNKYEVCVLHYLDLLHAHVDIYEYFKKHDIKNKDLYIFQQLIELTYILESSYFDYEELETKKLEYEKLLYDIYLSHKAEFDLISNDKKQSYYNYVKRDVTSYYKGLIIKEEFEEFIKRMGN